VTSAALLAQTALYAQPIDPVVERAWVKGAARASYSPADFMAAEVPAASAAPISGNTPWAAAYAAELRRMVVDYANRSERNLQSHLGPSEIGHSCHRQVAGKLAHLEPINHVTDPWPSIMGVAGHAWMEGAFQSANRPGRIRFLTERRVTPTMGFEGHPGTGDGYDAETQSVLDHKFLGKTSMRKLRELGAPRHYFVQTLLYSLGFIALGLPVVRVALLAWPRTESSIDGLYVWEHPLTEADFAFLRDVVEPELRYRKQWAAALLTGAAKLSDVPADTTDECHFCPFYRPQTARDGGPGCPGHATGQH
jgi:hypothetical protein